jgi:ATP-dependent helicase/nuclease subunit A
MLADEKIRTQALDPEQSFIVQAPAGSGKTELLIQRYLKLLGLASSPEEILAMTFTRKAATEMKERVFSALIEAKKQERPKKTHARFTWELAQKVLKQDQSLEWNLMSNPARLRIVTIDSFCASLIRRMPLLSGMGVGLNIQENAKSIYRETALSILKLAESATSPYAVIVRKILQHIDNSKEDFIKRIIQLLEKRDQWMISFFDPRDNLETYPLNQNTREDMSRTLEGLIQARLVELNNLFSLKTQESILRIATYSGRNLGDNNPSHPCSCLTYLKKFPDTTIDSLEVWKGIAHLFLTQTNTYRKKPDTRLGFPAGKNSVAKEMKTEFADLVNSLQRNPALLSVLTKVKKLPRAQFTNKEWDLLKSTIRLLAEINKTLKDVFSSHQTTDFTEISLSAISGLVKKDENGEEYSTDLLFYLDCKIHHILVDEYQDTSFKQEELLNKLTSEWSNKDGRTLFIVGDPKQSIYRFRDAEVGLFLKTQYRGLGNLHLKPLSLESNFRSQKNLVDWINTCFQKVFPKHEDSNLGAISYSPSSAVLKESIHPGVVYHPIPYNQDSHAISQKEARKISALVKELQSKYPNKSLAVLVRGRTHLTSIIRHFNESNIAFKAEAIDSITDRPAITDLLSLLRALRFPGDRTAWLSILRAPWCGLSLSDIHALVKMNKTTPIWFLLNDSFQVKVLSKDGQKRAQNFLQNIQPFIRGSADQNFRDVLESCWIRLGGPACLQGTSPDDIEVFFDKVEEIISSGQEEQFQNFDKILADLYASPLVVAENAVQIMTMHKAKGLEFDFVILPGLGKRIKGDEKRLIYWMPHGNDLLLAPIEEKGGETSALYEFLSDLNKEKEDYESLRLLYVAATRAKSQLHLFGHLEISKEGEWKPHSKSLLNKLWPHIKNDWLEKLTEAMDPGLISSKQKSISKHIIQRLPINFSLPIPAKSIVEGPVVDIEAEKYVEPEYYWAGNTARCLGNVLHRCLHDISLEGLEIWSKERIEKLKPQFKTALQGEGLPLEQAEEALGKGMLALSEIFEDERGLWILSSHEDAHSEYPLTFFENNRYIRSVIDRTFVDDGVRWIIDYKTGTHKGGGKNLEIFLDNEVQRYKKQLDRYEVALKKFGEKLPIKKALYFPLLKAWREIN